MDVITTIHAAIEELALYGLSVSFGDALEFVNKNEPFDLHESIVKHFYEQQNNEESDDEKNEHVDQGGWDSFHEMLLKLYHDGEVKHLDPSHVIDIFQERFPDINSRKDMGTMLGEHHWNVKATFNSMQIFANF